MKFTKKKKSKRSLSDNEKPCLAFTTGNSTGRRPNRAGGPSTGGRTLVGGRADGTLLVTSVMHLQRTTQRADGLNGRAGPKRAGRTEHD